MCWWTTLSLHRVNNFESQFRLPIKMIRFRRSPFWFNPYYTDSIVLIFCFLLSNRSILSSNHFEINRIWFLLDFNFYTIHTPRIRHGNIIPIANIYFITRDFEIILSTGHSHQTYSQFDVWTPDSLITQNEYLYITILVFWPKYQVLPNRVSKFQIKKCIHPNSIHRVSFTPTPATAFE